MRAGVRYEASELNKQIWAAFNSPGDPLSYSVLARKFRVSRSHVAGVIFRARANPHHYGL